MLLYNVMDYQELSLKNALHVTEGHCALFYLLHSRQGPAAVHAAQVADPFILRSEDNPVHPALLPRAPWLFLSILLATAACDKASTDPSVAPNEASSASGDDTAGMVDTLSGAALAVSPAALVNECAHARPEWIWCDDFDIDRLARYFEFAQAGGRFTRQPGLGLGSSYAMRSVYATTPQTSSGALHLAFGKTPQPYFRPVDAGTTKYREIYWRIFVRYPANWQGGGAEKLSRATSFVSSSSWAQAMIAHVWSGGSAPSSDYLFIDPASGTDAAGTVRTTTYNDFSHLRWLGRAQGLTPLFSASKRTAWHCVEAHARLNTANQSNGLFELWVDGQLDATRSGLNWVGNYSTYGINAVFIENYWNLGAPKVEERYLDNFIVSRARIGCGT